jgi:hypothetical protein
MQLGIRTLKENMVLLAHKQHSTPQILKRLR